MQKIVQRFIKQYNLLDYHSDKVLVGVSGGVDSMVLLDILASLVPKEYLLVAHCNFQLRGEESERDEAFVRAFCKKNNFTLHAKRFDTNQYAKTHKISVEMAARELRYGWFEELRKTYQCTQIAVAHHQNDQAETVLLNLTRGSGIRGLRGMLPQNGSIIRPLLCVSRHQIAQYAHERQIPFVEDSTNADTTIKRNKIRALLSHFSDSEIEHIAQNCQHNQQYITFVEQAMQKYMPQNAENGFEINTDFVFLQPDCAEMILFESLQQFDFPTKSIPDICLKIKEKKVGRQFFAPNYVAEIRQNHLLVSPLEVQENEPTLQWVVREKQPVEAYPQADAPTAFLDARKIKQPLTIRHWQHGDTFKPLGMRGKRKVSDIFTDLHFSHQQKRQQWLVCHGNDIVWMVGYRINEQYKITSSTTQICVISVS